MRSFLIGFLVSYPLALLFFTQVEVYRNHETGTPAVVVHIPNGEVGYSAGWFHCHSGEC